MAARFQKYRLIWPITAEQWYQVDQMFGEISTDLVKGLAIPAVLNPTGVIAGTYGSATLIPIITVGIDGRITTITTAAVTAAKSVVTDDNATNAVMYPVWVSATPGNEQLKTSSTELIWNPGFIAGGSFGFSVTPTAGLTARVLIGGQAATGIAPLLLFMNMGSAPTTYDSTAFAIVNEAMSALILTIGLSSNNIQLLARNSGGNPLGIELGTIQTTNLTLKTNNLVRWTLYSGGGFSNTALDPGATVLAQGGLLALGTTSTDGIVTENDTPSTALIPVQQSARLRFRSHVWNTTAVAADNINDFWIESVPASAAAPSGLLKFVSSLNGGGATLPMSLTSAGGLGVLQGLSIGGNFVTNQALTFPNGQRLQDGGAGFVALQPTGIGLVFASRTKLTCSVDGQLNISNNAVSTGVGFDVTTDALLKIRTRAQTGDASLSALNLSLSALIPTYNNIATVGGGVPAMYGLDNRTGRTSADGAAITLYTTINGTSVFRITADIFATAAVTGTAIYTLAWTENGTAQTLVVNSTTINTLATATDLINPDTATTITARLTGTFTGTFTVTGLVEQIK